MFFGVVVAVAYGVFCLWIKWKKKKTSNRKQTDKLAANTRTTFVTTHLTIENIH